MTPICTRCDRAIGDGQAYDVHLRHSASGAGCTVYTHQLCPPRTAAEAAARAEYDGASNALVDHVENCVCCDISHIDCSRRRELKKVWRAARRADTAARQTAR
ncbi:hypothetical protein ACFV0R_15760 [Streptomyces sp. NPDC059578]|uniref:hypothetical protein n=1 Tax=Streptomyces sp. NPDC059578 TaxID=3346874 RepID=UPI00367BB7BD